MNFKIKTIFVFFAVLAFLIFTFFALAVIGLRPEIDDSSTSTQSFRVLYYLSALAFTIIILSLVYLNRRILVPIKRLTQLISSFNKVTPNVKNTNYQKNDYFDDEIGDMAQTFFKMKRAMDDDLKRLKFALNVGLHGWFDIDLVKSEILISENYAKIIDHPDNNFVMPIDQWREGIHEDDLDAILQSLKDSIETGEINEGEYRRIKPDGNIIWLHVIGEVVDWDDKGNATRLIGVATDISERKLQQERLYKLAHYDNLTKLPNRNLFIKQFHRSIVECNRNNSQLAVVFLDLDDFKPVNDRYGHDVGDKLLVKVAHRIMSVIDIDDYASRQGGDEFALLLLNDGNSKTYDKKLENLLNKLAAPFNIDGVSINVTSSIGVTLYPNDYCDADLLLRHADQAMYRAKRAGKNQFHLFSTKKDKEIINKHKQLVEIKNALLNNHFELYYQPKVNMRTGKCYGAEALIRWIHPQKGLIPPLDFLPLVEGMELEIEIGNWVINEALKQLSQWHEQDISIKVSVNIASYHLQSNEFLVKLEQIIKTYPKVNPKYLQIEILESSILSDIESIRKTIDVCRHKLGIEVALDDFGTGYSSLTHLKSLSANTIKIDQSFVRDMLEDPSDLAIIEGVISLANSFNRDVIAEGVESTVHGNLLLLLGCVYAQGYGIAKPMPISEFGDWFASYKPNKSWLNESKSVRSDNARKLEILKITVLQWVNHFQSNVEANDSSEKNWPILDRSNCPCGTWLRHEIQKQNFSMQWLNQLDEKHSQFHNIADDIFVKFKTGDTKTANQMLKEFQKYFHEIRNLIENAF